MAAVRERRWLSWTAAFSNASSFEGMLKCLRFRIRRKAVEEIIVAVGKNGSRGDFRAVHFDLNGKMITYNV